MARAVLVPRRRTGKRRREVLDVGRFEPPPGFAPAAQLQTAVEVDLRGSGSVRTKVRPARSHAPLRTCGASCAFFLSRFPTRRSGFTSPVR
eukprot:11203096-Lingulodinium_polyedra.AAC.1